MESRVMKNGVFLLALLLAPPLLSAQADSEQISRRNKDIVPATGETRTVTAGESAVREVDQTEYLWAELLSDLRGSGTVILAKGARLWGATQDGSVREFCDVDLPGRVCLWDDDGNGGFDRAKVISSRRLTNISGRYRELWEPGEDRSDDGQRWELVYLGRGEGTLRFSAREYAGGDARPVSQSDLSFDLSPSGATIVAYRGIRIEISAATNEGITYQVLP